MKKTIQLGSLLFLLAITSLIIPAKAQDPVTKDLTTFTKRFEDACNKKDIKAIKEMFTKDAVRVNPEGQTETGNDAIVAAYEELFEMKLMVTIKQEKLAFDNGNNVATGTYHATGSNPSGDSFDVKGSFSNTMVKENGQWKISKQVLNSL